MLWTVIHEMYCYYGLFCLILGQFYNTDMIVCLWPLSNGAYPVLTVVEISLW